MLDSILVTKFYIPPARAELVQRPGLIKRLNAGIDRKLTLVSAPAGFGKTTLVSEWVEGLQKTEKVKDRQIKIAWLSLDEEDNDPIRFLAYIITALHKIVSEQDIGHVALSMLQSPQPAPHTSILISLINDLASIHDKIVIVLDDYHLIESEPIHQAVQFLLENLPPQVHLVILTRQDPYLSISRYRASDQLTELRASDLRFNRSETAAFLNNVMGLDLSDEDVVRLEARTEGWIAGLQLAAISIQGRDDASDRIETFSGSHRLVLDYLIDEVLDRQRVDLREFLLKTSILSRLTGPLCDELTGKVGGQATLEKLDQSNLFIVPLDDQRVWYRYHHLFAELLRQRLGQTQPEILPGLHRIASVWYERNELHDQAIDHAVSSGDFERSASLLDRHAEHVWRRGELNRLFRWVQKLPREVLFSRPMLCVYDAWIGFIKGQQEVAEDSLQAAENALMISDGTAKGGKVSGQDLGEALDASIAGRVATIRAELAFFRGDLPAVDKNIQIALKQLTPEDLSFRSAATITLGDAHGLRGDLANAYDARLEAAKLSKAGNNQYLRLVSIMKLAVTLRQMGRLEQIVELLDREISVAEQSGMSQTGVFGSIYAIWAEVLAEFGSLDQAVGLVRKGVELAERGQDVGSIGWCYLCSARIFYSSHDIASVERIFQSSANIHERIGIPPWAKDPIDAWRARVWLDQGDSEKALQWVRDRGVSLEGDISYQRRTEYLVLVRVLLAQEKGQEALGLLQRLLEFAEELELTSFTIKLLVLQALTFQSIESEEQAIVSLERALQLAEPRGFLQVFVDEGPPMANLLYEALKREIAPGYVQRLLAAFRDAQPEGSTQESVDVDQSDMIEPLSDREIQVLDLIAKGFTNQVIADRLVLSLHTVKTHTRNIYGKLGVNNRTQAVDRARILGIL